MSVEFEANDDDENKPAFLQLDHYKEIDEGHTYLPQSSEFEKEICVDGCQEAEVTIYGLESRTEDLNIQEELSHILDETSASKEHVFIPERELELAHDERLKCVRQAQIVESAFSLNKLRTEVLKETVLETNLVANKTEKGKEDGESMQVEAGEGYEEVEILDEECMTKRVVNTEHELEAEILDKSLLIDSLQSRLHRANELHCCVEIVAFDAIREANVLKAELELKEVKILEQEYYINQLETEAEGLKMELIKANEESKTLVESVEEMKEELDETRKRIIEDRNKENEAEIEIALLKSELHKGRSRLAAAAAAEERSKVEKSAVNVALYHLAVEALEARTENNRLKEAMKKTSVDSVEANDDKVDFNVMISKEEYEVLLIKNTELANHVQNMMDPENYKIESEQLKKELQIANAKITELRSRAAQAISRAEAAEKVKETLEARVKRWKDQRAKQKATTLTTLHVESKNFMEEDGSLRYKSAPKVHQPLGKILNMKY